MINKYLPTIRWLFILSLSVGVMSSCSLTPKQQDQITPAQRTLSDNEDATYPIRIYDPLESFNRGAYKFNTKFDQYVFYPLFRVTNLSHQKLPRPGLAIFSPI